MKIYLKEQQRKQEELIKQRQAEYEKMKREKEERERIEEEKRQRERDRVILLDRQREQQQIEDREKEERERIQQDRDGENDDMGIDGINEGEGEIVQQDVEREEVNGDDNLEVTKSEHRPFEDDARDEGPTEDELNNENMDEPNEVIEKQDRSPKPHRKSSSPKSNHSAKKSMQDHAKEAEAADDEINEGGESSVNYEGGEGDQEQEEVINAEEEIEQNDIPMDDENIELNDDARSLPRSVIRDDKSEYEENRDEHYNRYIHEDAKSDTKSEKNSKHEKNSDKKSRSQTPSNKGEEEHINDIADQNDDEEIISVHKDDNRSISSQDSIDIDQEESLMFEIETLSGESKEVKEKADHLKYIIEKLNLLRTEAPPKQKDNSDDEGEEDRQSKHESIDVFKLMRKIQNQIGLLKDPDFTPEPLSDDEKGKNHLFNTHLYRIRKGLR